MVPKKKIRRLGRHAQHVTKNTWEKYDKDGKKVLWFGSFTYDNSEETHVLVVFKTERINAYDDPTY